MTNLLVFCFGAACGGALVAVAVWLFVRNEEEKAIKALADRPLPILEERKITDLRAECIVTLEEMLLAGPELVARKVSNELKEKLTEEVWRYALTERCEDPLYGGHLYRAKISVVDDGLYNVMIQTIE